MRFKIEICPECKQNTYKCYLEDRSYVRECTNCGNSVLSFSYFGNCENQRDICEYVLDFSNVNKEGLVEFCKRYHMKLITLLKLIRMRKTVHVRCEISEVLEEERFFENIELGYVMDPPIPYSNFYTCKDAIRPKWLNSTVEVIFD